MAAHAQLLATVFLLLLNAERAFQFAAARDKIERLVPLNLFIARLGARLFVGPPGEIIVIIIKGRKLIICVVRGASQVALPAESG